MKPIDKKEMPKLIALIAVAVIAFGYGIFTFMSGSGAKPPPPAPTPEAKAGASGKPDEPVDDGTWHPETLVVALPLGARDPFMPEGASAPKATPSPVPATTPAPDATPAPPLARPGGGGPSMSPPSWPVPPLTISKGKFKVPHVKPTPVPTPIPAPVPSLNVSGVLVSEEAERSVAIIKDDKKGNRFLSIGDAAGNGWRVTGIKEREIEITDPKTGRRKTVEMKP
jgi:hypothetical protein